ncbi:MAG: hypothetical protein GY797_12300 [Deltaproteobacteria bacterium]|nr:hypothetical protein [Deltaproteobacteria bacterium]
MSELNNPILSRFRTRKSELDELFKVLISNGHMNKIEQATYRKPGQSIKYKISMLVCAITRNISEIQKQSAYNNSNLAYISKFIERELQLIDYVQRPETLQRILKTANLPCPVQLEVTKVPARISYPFIVSPKKSVNHYEGHSYFIRYSALIGDMYINRYHPREVVFQQIMAEIVLREFISDELVVSTLYPNINIHKRHPVHKIDDPFDEIKHRVIIQENHTKGWHLLTDHNNFVEVAELFGRIIGIIHAGTWRQNLDPTGMALRFFCEFRDQTPKQYEYWLREKNWIPKIYASLKQTAQKEKSSFRAIALKSVQDELDDVWNQSVEQSICFWKDGAVLVPPDINPRNIFVNNKQSLKIIDLDNILILDPTYHVGRSLHILLHTAIQMNIWNVQLALKSIEAFHSSYESTLCSMNAGFTTTDKAFRSNMKRYAAFNYISYYLASADALALDQNQVEAIIVIGKSLLAK